MTAHTTTIKGLGKKGPEKAKATSGYPASPFIGAITDGALLSWLAGVGLNRGFGVHVPFIAGWVLGAAFLALVFSVASHASAAHHQQAVKAAPHIAAGTMTGMTAAQAVLDAQGFLDIDKKLRGE